MAVDEAALDAFLADPSTPGGDLNPTGEAAAAPAETPAVETPAAEVEHTIPEPTAEQDSFDRAYVEKLRRESAGYRERAKRYNDVFDGYEEDAVEEWLTLAATLKEDPKTAAARFAELAEAINSQFQEEGQAEVAAIEAEADAPLTRKELEAFWAAKQAETEQAMLVKKIELDAKELGYEKGSDDYELLLFEASRLKNGSIQEAHAKIEARNKAILDAHLAKLGMQPNPKVPAEGAAASQERQLKTFEEANSALDAWLASQP